MGDLHTYWRQLSPLQKVQFADKSELSVKYIETHLIHKRKIPYLPTIEKMAEASEGQLSIHDLVDFFIKKAEPITTV